MVEDDGGVACLVFDGLLRAEVPIAARHTDEAPVVVALGVVRSLLRTDVLPQLDDGQGHMCSCV